MQSEQNMKSVVKQNRKTRDDETYIGISKQITKRGKPKGVYKIQLEYSGAWTSILSCIKFVDFLTKTRIFYYHNCYNSKSQRDIEQNYQNEIKLQSIAKKERIKNIKVKSQRYYGLNNLKSQCVAFFFKQNYDKSPEEGKTCLENLANLHMRMTLGKVYQLLDPKFFQELVELIVQLEYTHQIDQIVEELLNQAQLSPNDNTIIQYFFIKYCYREEDDEMENLKETFNKWKSNQKKQIIEEIVQFIKDILISLEVMKE